MSLMDTIITMIVKKGVLYEARNTVIETELPDTKIKVKISIENMKISMEKEGA